MSNMPVSFTTFSDSLSWAMFRFSAPGIPIPTVEEYDAYEEDDFGNVLLLNSTNATVAGMSSIPFASQVRRAQLAGTVFWNGLTLIAIVLGHVAVEYHFFNRGKVIPAEFAFPAMEIKLVTLSLPGLLSTSMAVMADKYIGPGYTCLGTLVVLGCIVFVGLCVRVLHMMEKRKPVRFIYEENFIAGRKGEFASYLKTPLKWKLFALFFFRTTSMGRWETQTQMFEDFESGGWDGLEHSLLPAWVTVRIFGERVGITEQAAQFHRNWAPLYAKFHGHKGKINYVIEMGSVFFMSVFICLHFPACQA